MRNLSIGKTTAEGLLRAACVLVLCGILLAGLWPFHAPKNAVNWLSNRNGLLFGDYGSILSAGEFRLPASQDEPCSVEIWLQPAATFDSNDIVAFSTEKNPVQFAVAQSGDDLFVIRNVVDPQQHVREYHLAVDHVFRAGYKLLITITSGPRGTVVYLNGTMAKTSPKFTFNAKDFTGELVIGNSPVRNNTWGGQLWGLGIVDRDLTAAEVLQHYDSWSKDSGVQLVGEGDTRALYVFDEGEGRVVHNQIASEPDLRIPEHYFVLHKKFLEPFWREFRPNWVFARDVILNVVAFVPLGFLLYAYFSSVRALNRPRLVAIILGGAVSLTIEILQAYLPTRESGTLDIITNTTGAAAGAILCGSHLVQVLLAKTGLRTSKPRISKFNQEVEPQLYRANAAARQEEKMESRHSA
jgi:VanZ family protein